MTDSKFKELVETNRIKIERLYMLGVLSLDKVRDHNIGSSDYSKHLLQPWSIWAEYNLNAWDADIVKRVLRTKYTDSRKLDYEKIIHDCQERIRQLDVVTENYTATDSFIEEHRIG